jgi:isoleucyl-tRNA synthetase
MRWLYASHNPDYDLWFGYHKIHEARRQFLTLWNVYEFFITYARIDEFDPASAPVPIEARPELDRWILYRLQNLVASAHRNYSGYSIHYLMRDVLAFIDALSRWYLRRSRRRFWKSRNDDDKLAAYQTLWECLTTTAKLLAPIIPFSTEKMYQELVRYYDATAPASIHLCDFPKVNEAAAVNDAQLLHAMDSVLEIVEQGHAARNKAGQKVRQPLAAMRIEAAEKGLAKKIAPFIPLILDELNVKKAEFVASAADLYAFSVHLDAKTGKPKFGRHYEALQKVVGTMPPEDIARKLMEEGALSLQVEGESFALQPEDSVIEKLARQPWARAEGNGFLGAVNAELDAGLIREGLVRDLVRHVQNIRKEIGLDVVDRIRVGYVAGDELAAAVQAHSEYLAGETLALEIERRSDTTGKAHQVKLGGESIQLMIRKA